MFRLWRKRGLSATAQDERVPVQKVFWFYLGQFDVLLTWLLAVGLVGAALYGATAAELPAQAMGRTFASQATAVLVVAATMLRGAIVALAIAGAAGAIGALIGFLFGLPRTLTSAELRSVRSNFGDLASGRTGTPDGSERKDGGGADAKNAAPGPDSESPAPAKTRTTYTDVNTNLEQISDWLTKIIVGIGLTELRNIPDALGDFGNNVGNYYTYGGHVYGVGGGLYFLIAGFFLGYVGTRVRLSLVFTGSQTDNDAIAGGATTLPSDSQLDLSVRASPAGAAANVVDVAGAQQGAGTTTPAIDAESLRQADKAILGKSVAELTTPKEIRALANALAREGRARAALDLYRDLWRKNAYSSPEFLFDFAQVYALAGVDDEAQRFATTASTLTPIAPAEIDKAIDQAALRGEVLAGLYENKGRTFRDAITAIETILQKYPAQEADPRNHIWRACAYGQRFAHLLANGGSEAELEQDRQTVRAAVKRAIELDPAAKSELACYYFKERIRNGDDDLAALYPDPVLTDLLGPETETPAT